MPFNIADFPLAWELPPRMTRDSSWLQHTPMVPILIALTRPRLLVELGAHAGDSYCAFCESVLRLNTGTQCAAVDTWAGDPHAGQYGPEILQDLRNFHDRRYASFSHLMQMTFDAAVPSFPDASIDLLHIDGLHTYEAVLHDFTSWRPKLSDRAVVLFHDTTARLPGFGVFQFWDEIAPQFPSFNVPYGWGLGILAVGKNVPPPFLSFLQELKDDPRILGLLDAIGQRNAHYRNLHFASDALLKCHEIANQWRTHTGNAAANRPVELAQVINFPQSGAFILSEILQLANAAVENHLELKKLRPAPSTPLTP